MSNEQTHDEEVASKVRAKRERDADVLRLMGLDAPPADDPEPTFEEAMERGREQFAAEQAIAAERIRRRMGGAPEGERLMIDRQEIADRHGVGGLADRLHGETRGELEADAAALAATTGRRVQRWPLR